MKSILIVEDEQSISDIIKNRLESQGYTCDTVMDGKSAICKLAVKKYDLATVDIMIPEPDGIEVCDYLHKNSPSTLVLVISSLDTQEQRIRAYSVGADDFIGKPFSSRELAAKIEAQFRRLEITKNANITPLSGDLHINEEAKKVILSGRQVGFTPSEYLLFVTLAKNSNLVFSREKLSQVLWEEGLELLDDRVIDSHIYHMRKKLTLINADYKNIIKTVRGFGYQIHAI